MRDSAACMLHAANKFFIINDFFFQAQWKHFLHFLKGSFFFHFLLRQKTLNHRVDCTRVAKLKPIFPALTTPFSFQPIARSLRAQSSRVLDLQRGLME